MTSCGARGGRAGRRGGREEARRAGAQRTQALHEGGAHLQRRGVRPRQLQQLLRQRRAAAGAAARRGAALLLLLLLLVLLLLVVRAAPRDGLAAAGRAGLRGARVSRSGG
jgi:hypothetical protein